mmetsp:Transcript_40736/g.161478  ORF Transcript_40736/g.161478 Transcript_40736/m.161478 type:complete len:292 (-) Transcript_40736:1067-1942(-)
MVELKKVVKKSKTKNKLLKKRRLKKKLAAVKERLVRSRDARLTQKAGLEGGSGIDENAKQLDDVVKLSMKVDDGIEDVDGGMREVGEGEPGTGDKSKASVLAKGKRKKVDANWATLKKAIGAGKRKRRTPPTAREPTDVAPVEGQKVGHATKALALDCEMVGVGPDGRRNALARIAVVNSKLEAVYHAWVRPSEKVVDYRTQYSGVRPEDILSDVAVSFSEAQQTVADLLKVMGASQLWKCGSEHWTFTNDILIFCLSSCCPVANLGPNPRGSCGFKRSGRSALGPSETQH